MGRYGFQEYLAAKKGLFFKVLNKFKIDANRLGLGSFPESHNYPTNGMLVPLRYIAGAYYYVSSHDGLAECNQKRPLIVHPEDDRIYSNIVSIFHNAPSGGCAEEFFNRISDIGLAGLLAHECSEYIHSQKCPAQFGIEHEIKMDHEAKLFGFGSQLIRYFLEKIDMLTQDDGQEAVSHKGTIEKINNAPFILELEERINVLKSG